MDAELGPAAEFLRCSCQFRVLLETVLDCRTLQLGMRKKEHSNRNWAKLYDILSGMTNFFSGFDSEARLFIEECRIRLIASRFAFSSGNDTRLTPVFTACLDQFRKTLCDTGSDAKSMDFLDRITTLADSAADSDLSGRPLDPTLKQSLLHTLQSFPLKLISESGLRCLKEKESWISDPSSDSDTTIRFVSGLVTSVEVTACFRHLSPYETEDIRIRILYPDMKETLFKPRKSDFKFVSAMLIRLRCDVLLSSISWSEKAPVLLELVQMRRREELNYVECILFGEKAKPWTEPSSAKKNTGNSVEVFLFPKLKC